MKLIEWKKGIFEIKIKYEVGIEKFIWIWLKWL